VLAIQPARIRPVVGASRFVAVVTIVFPVGGWRLAVCVASLRRLTIKQYDAATQSQIVFREFVKLFFGRCAVASLRRVAVRSLRRVAVAASLCGRCAVAASLYASRSRRELSRP
jgi:hypothetical protein